MIDHISLRCSDMARSASFYQQALAPLGYEVIMEFPGAVGLGAGGKPDFWVTQGEVGTPGHVAFAADRPTVDAFYRAALAAGGTDHGAPGPRAEYHPSYYGAFVLDPDGHNIEAVCHAPPVAAPSREKRAAKKDDKKPDKAKKDEKRAAKKADREASKKDGKEKKSGKGTKKDDKRAKKDKRASGKGR